MCRSFWPLATWRSSIFCQKGQELVLQNPLNPIGTRFWCLYKALPVSDCHFPGAAPGSSHRSPSFFPAPPPVFAGQKEICFIGDKRKCPRVFPACTAKGTNNPCPNSRYPKGFPSPATAPGTGVAPAVSSPAHSGNPPISSLLLLSAGIG